MDRTSRGVRGLIIFLVLVTFVVTVKPIIIKYVALRWMSDQGLHPVVIEDVDFNPFLGKFRVLGVSVGLDGDSVLEIQKLSLRVDWLPLFKNRIQIESIGIQGASLSIVQIEDQLRVAGLLIPSVASGESVSGSEWQLALDSLHITDTVVNYQRPEFQRLLSISTFSLANLVQWSPDNQTSISLRADLNNQPLSVDATLQPFAPELNVDWQMALDAIDITPLAKLSGQLFDGQVDAQLRGTVVRNEAGLTELAQTGLLSLSQLEWKHASEILSVAAIEWDINSSIHIEDEANLKYSVDGPLSIQQLALASGDGPALIELEKLTSSRLQFDSADGLDLGSLVLSQLRVNVRRAEDGQLQGMPMQTAESNDKAIDADAASLRTRWADIHIEHGRIRFSDQSVTPAFEQTLAIDSLRLGALDSEQPERAASLDIKGTIGEHSTLSTQGKLAAFSQPLALELKTEISALELPPMSSYTRDVLGYVLTSGQINTTLDLTIKQGRFEGSQSIKLSQLTVEAALDEEGNPIQIDAPVPLDTGLAMLRDGDDNISMDIPISGDMENPEFDVSSVIRQAIGKAIASASMTYLKFALQPYGAILAATNLIQDAQKQAESAALQAIEFDAGSLALGPQAQDYIPKLAKLLGARPQLTLKLCGMASEAERQIESENKGKEPEALTDAALLELARGRALAVKTEMIERHGVSAERLFVCHPAIGPERDATPRVELKL